MRALASALVVVLACSLLNVRNAQSQEDFYKNKQMTMVIGFGAGGGIDGYGRLLARHLGRHIPGNPTIVPQNMPGAGGITAVKHVQSAAPKDGTVLMTFHPSQIVASIFNPEQIGVNFSEFSWLGSVSNDLRVCFVMSSLGAKTVDDLKKKNEVAMGNSGPSTAAYLDQRILIDIFGVKVKQVAGYPGSAEKRLAMERGELDGDCSPWTSTPLDWVRDKKIDIFLRLQKAMGDGLPEGVPFAGDLLKSEEDKQVLALLGVSSEIGRPFLMAKEVPADRLKILRNAFNETMKDPQFLADAEKLRFSVAPMSGEDVTQQVKDLASTPKSVVARAKTLAGE